MLNLYGVNEVFPTENVGYHGGSMVLYVQLDSRLY